MILAFDICTITFANVESLAHIVDEHVDAFVGHNKIIYIILFNERSQVRLEIKCRLNLVSCVLIPRLGSPLLFGNIDEPWRLWTIMTRR